MPSRHEKYVRSGMTRMILAIQGFAPTEIVRGRFASLCPSCRCMIWWICNVTACRRAWLCLDSRVSKRKRYPSDLSDERRVLIEP